MPPPPNILDAIRVETAPVEPGRYTAFAERHWNAPVHPSGGVTTAIALRAMGTELGRPHQALRSFSTMFVSTVGGGAMDVRVDTLRIGKRMSQLRADVRSPGAANPGHLVTGAFGETREGFEFSYARAPDVNSPDDYPGLAEPPAGSPSFRPAFFQQVDIRRVRMFASFETGWEAGRAETIRWIRYHEAPRTADGRIERLSLVPLADTMPLAVGQFLGPGYRCYHAPSVDLSMRFFADTDQEWVLAHTVSHWAGDGYASAEITLWDFRRRLLAHANQLMLIRFPALSELQSD